MRFLYFNIDDTDNRILEALRSKLHSHTIEQWPQCEDLSQIDAAIVWKPPIDFFNGLDNLRAIFSVSAGVDHLLNHPHLPTNTSLVRLTDAGMAQPMAEYVLYGVLHAQRRMNEMAQAQRERVWRHEIKPYLAEDFRVGILGAGELGQIAARRLLANGYAVSCWSRTAKELTDIEHYAGVEGLKAMLASVQALVCLLPLTKETTGIIDEQLLSGLPSGAFIINPGRGDHVNDNALLSALDSGHISGALLDVFQTEPLPSEHAYWQHPNVIITPHVAANTSLKHAVEQIAEGVEALEQGKTPRGLVSFEHGY